VTHKSLPRTGAAHTKRTWTGMGSICVVLVRFSPAGCTSIRIAVTLGYEQQLVRDCHQVVIYEINIYS
jgi:hypothetical protein